jgi:NDP-sugar pyrophosphorylase family protein
MYVLSPHVLDCVPKDTLFDMPALFDALAKGGRRTRCHPVDGYWLDIGRASDYEKAKSDFDEVFR